MLLDFKFQVFFGAFEMVAGLGVGDMPGSNSVWTKSSGPAIAATAALAGLAGLAACTPLITKETELISGSEAQVVIIADLHNSPRPLAKSHCAQYGKVPLIHDTVPAVGNLLRGWATGTKVFVYTFDCR